jgi:hypothetical protein
MTARLDLQRLPGWPEALAAHIERHRATPFDWVAHTCIHFGAGAVLAMTGTDALAGIARWKSAAGAQRLLAAAGGLAAALDARLPRLAAIAHAQRGDLLLVRARPGMEVIAAREGGAAGEAGLREWLAVSDGALWWAPHRTGLDHGPAFGPEVVAAWGVGHG